MTPPVMSSTLLWYVPRMTSEHELLMGDSYAMLVGRYASALVASRQLMEKALTVSLTQNESLAVMNRPFS